MWPARASLLASWWLLREIEAAHAIREHIEIDQANKRVNWRLPPSKTDWKALGATRSHSCSCECAPAAEPSSPVFPSSVGSPASKTGWADTFQHLRAALGLPTSHPNGARSFTGHSARASGAVHLAASQIEVWRIQLFGRWGS